MINEQDARFLKEKETEIRGWMEYFLKIPSLVDSAKQFFDSLKTSNKGEQFLALDSFGELLSEHFQKKESSLPGPDDRKMISLILYYHYHGISHEQIFRRMFSPLAQAYDPNFDEFNNKIKYSESLDEYTFQIKENVTFFSEALINHTFNMYKSVNNGNKYKSLINPYLETKIASMSHILGGVANSFSSTEVEVISKEAQLIKEKNWEYFVKDSFKKIESAILNQPSYKKLEEFVKKMEKIIWYLSIYLLAFPYKIRKIQDKQALVEDLMEKIYLESDVSDAVENGRALWLLENKVQRIESLFFEFLEKSNSKALNRILWWAINQIQDIKEKPQPVDHCLPSQMAPDHVECNRKKIHKQNSLDVVYFDEQIQLRYQDRQGSLVCQLVPPLTIIEKLYEVPFKLIKQKRQQFQDALDNSSIVNQFLQFLKDLFIGSDVLIQELKKDNNFKMACRSTLPEELKKKNCFDILYSLKDETKNLIVKRTKKLHRALMGKDKDANKKFMLGQHPVKNVTRQLFFTDPYSAIPLGSYELANSPLAPPPNQFAIV